MLVPFFICISKPRVSYVASVYIVGGTKQLCHGVTLTTRIQWMKRHFKTKTRVLIRRFEDTTTPKKSAIDIHDS